MKLLGTAPSQVPTNADLGTMSTQNADDVNITGGFSYNANKTAANYYNDTTITDTKPSLVLDFANSKALDPRVTFSRASTATYYDGKSSAVAEQNLVTYSQDFTQSAWNKTNSTISASAGIAPDGTLTASAITLNASGNSGYFAQSITYVSGSTYSLSVYIKSGNTSKLQVQSNAWGTLSFDVSNQTYAVISGTAISAGVVTIGSGWYRCYVTFTATSGGAQTTYVRGDASASLGDNFFVWGTQLEQRSTATAYTPTTTTAITNYIPTLQTAAAGVPRFDHDPITGESKGLLIEEQRTNLALYSGDLSNPSFYFFGGTRIKDVIAPDGSISGTRMFHPSNSTANFGITATYTTLTYSIYVKNITGTASRTFLMRNASTSTNFDVGLFNFDGTISGTGWSSQLISNGWYRISYTRSTGITVGDSIICYTGSSSSSNPTYNGEWALWGAQVEAGPFPTSYIPTTSSAVTRSQDNAYISGTNFSSWYNQSQGTICADFYPNAIYSGAYWGGVVSIDDGASNYVNTTLIRVNPNIVIVTNNSSANLSAPFNLNVLNKVAVGTQASNYAASTNGATVVTNSFALPPSNRTSIAIGADSQSGGGKLNGTLKKIAYYPARLSNSELQEMTQ